MKDSDKGVIVCRILELSKEDAIAIVRKFQDLGHCMYFGEKEADKIHQFIDESGSLRKAAMAGAILAFSIKDDLPNEEDLDALIEKKNSLFEEIMALNEIILKKAAEKEKENDDSRRGA